MFDSSKSIGAWRSRLASTGAMFEADLDELESHLRDEIEALEDVGFTAPEAFRIATEKLGETGVLAGEFAKVNPLLVWRAALFWITLGIFLVLALRPLQELAIPLTIGAALALHLNKLAVTAACWAVAFASPLAFFGLLFSWARRHVDAPLPWAARPSFRIAIVVGCVLLMLAALLGPDLGHVPQRWEGPMLRHAWHSVWNATYALGVAAPLTLGGIALQKRSLAMQNRASAAPLFWLAVGLFIGCVRCELHELVPGAAYVGAGLAGLGPRQMATLMWILTLGCPFLLFASIYGYLRHRAPSPSRLLRARGVLLAMSVSGAIGIAAVFATSAVAKRGYEMVSRDVIFDGFNAWLLASVVTSCWLPIIVGTIMLKLRQAGALAMPSS